MFISLAYILMILEKYKYLLIFPITIFEGPIIIILSGFLAYLGFLNIFIIFPLLVVGDLIGDTVYYSMGRYSNKFKWVKKIGSFLGYEEKSEEFLKNHFQKHTIKTLLLGKIAHGLGAVVQVSAGMAEVNFLEYFFIQLIGTIPKTLLLFIIGFYLGASYLKIDTYLDIIAYVVIGLALFIFLYLVLKKYSKKLLSEE